MVSHQSLLALCRGSTGGYDVKKIDGRVDGATPSGPTGGRFGRVLARCGREQEILRLGLKLLIWRAHARGKGRAGGVDNTTAWLVVAAMA